jgi:hypothetical protein
MDQEHEPDAHVLKLRNRLMNSYPNGVSSYSPGLPGFAGYPGSRRNEDNLPQRGYVIQCDAASHDATPLGLISARTSSTQGSPQSRATLGYRP